MMVYYGKGFTHDDIYSMPIYLRNFYLQKLINLKEEEKKAMEKANKKPSSTPSRLNIPQR